MSQKEPEEPKYVSWISDEELEAREKALRERKPFQPGNYDILKELPEPDLTVVDP